MVNRKRNIITIVVAICSAVLISTVFFANGEITDDHSSFAYAGILSLLPATVAITLAFITKEVYSSLFAGIATGALLYANGHAGAALTTLAYHPQGGLISCVTDTTHASIIIFMILLATLVVLMNRSGGAAAFGRWTKKHIKSKRGAQLTAMLMGLFVFVDDGFNCLTVGSVMRPITDMHNTSRAKLAYIIDSTAAPVCIIAPISCWAAAVSGAIPRGLDINGFTMFIKTIPYNLYAIGTLFMVLILAIKQKDYGPMKIHEQNAMNGDLFSGARSQEEPNTGIESEENSKMSNLIIPIVSLIIFCIIGMLYTGGFFSGTDIITAFAESDSAKGMVLGTLVALILTFCLYTCRGIMKLKDFMNCFTSGFRTMCCPLIILALSWNLSGMTNILGADIYIHNAVSATANTLLSFIPAFIFAISVILAFATGTSWGTFSILIPIVCAIFPVNSEILVIAISACLAGAICGDHCSPISDTTILSSAGAHCDHLSHVSTQLPYAFTVAGVCFVGYIISGLIGIKTDSGIALIATPVTLGIIYATITFLTGKTVEKRRK